MHPQGGRERSGSVSGCSEVLANPPYIFLVSGTSRLSFKLCNLFPGFLPGCAVPSSYVITFLDLLGFHALILSYPFPRLSQARLLHFMVSHPCGSSCTGFILQPVIWPQGACLQQKDFPLCHPSFYCASVQQRNFPLIMYPLSHTPKLGNQGEPASCSPRRLENWSLRQRTLLFPWMSVRLQLLHLIRLTQFSPLFVVNT